MGEIRDLRQKNSNGKKNDNWKLEKNWSREKSRKAVRVSVKSVRKISICSTLCPVHTCDANVTQLSSCVQLSRVAACELNWRRDSTQRSESEQSWPSFPIMTSSYFLSLFVLALLTKQLELETGSRQFSHTLTLDKFSSVFKFAVEIRRQLSRVGVAACEFGISVILVRSVLGLL